MAGSNVSVRRTWPSWDDFSSLVTPLNTVIFPSGMVTRLGYHRPYFIGAVAVCESSFGSKIHDARSPSSSRKPTSAGAPSSRSMSDGSL